MSSILEGCSGSPAFVPPHLERFIADHDVDVEILRPGVPMPTVALAAAAIGVPEALILKTLVFETKDGRLVVAIAAGTTRVDRKRLAAAAGLPSLHLANPATVLAVTGFPVGGVAPIAHSSPLPVFIDEHAATLAVVYGGAGSEYSLLRIRPADIIRLTGATVAAISIPE